MNLTQHCPTPPAESRRRGGILRLLFWAIVLTTVVAVLAWIFLLRGFVAGRVAQRTGFPTDIATLQVNPFAGSVLLEGLTIRNPPSFPRQEFIELRRLELDVGIGSLFGSRLEVPVADLDLDQIVLVIAADGTRNYQLFQERLAPASTAETGQPAAAQEPPAKEPAAAKPYLIGRLHLRLERVVLIDYSRGKPRVNEVKLGLDKTFTQVTKIEDVVNQVLISPEVSQAMSRLLLKFLSDGDGSFFDRAGDSLRGAGQSVKEGARELWESVKPKP